MAETTWKQAVYDIADAYREAEGTEDKISIANLKEKVREGSSKVTLDGEKVKELAMTSYKGANPLTIGADGATFDPNVLLQAGLQIINGVNGEDLTDPIALLSAAVAENLRLAKSKYSESKNTGQYVWKKYSQIMEIYTNPIFSFVTPRADAVWGITSASFDVHKVDESFFDGFTFDQTYNSQTTVQQLVYRDGALYGTGGIFGSNYPRIEYDPETASFTSAHSLSASVRTLSNGRFVGQKEYAKKEFVGYVTADDENSYPDGGEQDDYWYELLKTGVPYAGDNPLTIGESGVTIPANTLIEAALQIVNGVEAGVSGIDYGTITYSSSYSGTIKINHNLKVEPTKVLLMRVGGSGGTPSSGFGAFAATESQIYFRESYGGGYDILNAWPESPTLTTTSITINQSSALSGSPTWMQGTYVWAAIA